MLSYARKVKHTSWANWGSILVHWLTCITDVKDHEIGILSFKYVFYLLQVGFLFCLAFSSGIVHNFFINLPVVTVSLHCHTSNTARQLNVKWGKLSWLIATATCKLNYIFFNQLLQKQLNISCWMTIIPPYYLLQN